jgi:hypothetical protein
MPNPKRPEVNLITQIFVKAEKLKITLLAIFAVFLLTSNIHLKEKYKKPVFYTIAALYLSTTVLAAGYIDYENNVSRKTKMQEIKTNFKHRDISFKLMQFYFEEVINLAELIPTPDNLEYYNQVKSDINRYSAFLSGLPLVLIPKTLYSIEDYYNLMLKYGVNEQQAKDWLSEAIFQCGLLLNDENTSDKTLKSAAISGEITIL